MHKPHDKTPDGRCICDHESEAEVFEAFDSPYVMRADWQAEQRPKAAATAGRTAAGHAAAGLAAAESAVRASRIATAERARAKVKALATAHTNFQAATRDAGEAKGGTGFVAAVMKAERAAAALADAKEAQGEDASDVRAMLAQNAERAETARRPPLFRF